MNIWGMIAMQVGTALMKTMSQQQYAEQQEQALEMREDEERLAATQQANKANDNIERIMGKQIVYAASSGLTPGSFSPIEERDFDAWSRDRNAINLNLQFKEAAIDSEMDAIDKQMAWAPILNLFGAAQGIYNMQLFKGGSGGGASTATGGTSAGATTTPVQGTINAGRYYGVSEKFRKSLVEKW